jgi:hypothetical protein
MSSNDHKRLISSSTAGSLPIPRFLQPGPPMFHYPASQSMGTYISFPQAQPYFTGVGTVPVTMSSTQQYISANPIANSSYSLAAPRLFPMYQTSQNLSSYPTYSSGPVVLPSNTSYMLSSSIRTENISKKNITPLSLERAECVITVDENVEPTSPGRSSRPTSLSPRDARLESMNSSVFPFQENKPLMTSPTRRSRNQKVKGELVGLRVAEIESDIIKRTMKIPRKQNSELSAPSISSSN